MVKIHCNNCQYEGDANMMFKTTSPTPFCPKCGTSDVVVTESGVGI